MSRLDVGIALALAASVALNGSYLLQHAGSAGAVAITPRRPVATLRSLLASPAWVLGAALGLTGWAMHIGALSRAPLSLVQAFVAGGRVLTVPMAALGLGHRVSRQERRGAAAMALALALLALGLRGEGRHAHADAVTLAGYTAALALGAAALSAGVRGAARASALGLAGGMLYGAADLAIKELTGAANVLGSPWLAVAGLTTAGAFFAFQRGLQAGRPVTVIALMTAATNVSSISGGFAVFGDPLGRTPLLSAAHAAAFGLVALGAWWLAPAQAALSAAPSGAAGPRRRRQAGALR